MATLLRSGTLVLFSLASGCALDWKAARSPADAGSDGSMTRVDSGTPGRDGSEPVDGSEQDEPDSRAPSLGDADTDGDGGEDAGVDGGVDATVSTACTDGTDVCGSDYPCFAANGTYTCRGQLPDWPAAIRESASSGFEADIPNGTVLDRNTGLVWTRSTGGDVMNYTQAVARCRGLSAGGTDFRLPSVAEWSTMLNTRVVPDVDLTLFPDGAGEPYWTSSPSNPTKSDVSGRFMFVVGGSTSGVLIYPVSRAEQKRVGCVRTAEARFSGPPTERLELHEEFVHDRISDLYWHRAGREADENYAVSEAFCRESLVGGRTWRVPTVAELLTIADPTQVWFQPAPSVFTGWVRDIYWTSNVPVGAATPRHYAFDFGFANDSLELTQVDDVNTMPCCPVRCVSSP